EECIQRGGKVRVLIGSLFTNANYDRCIQFAQKWSGQFKIFVSTNPNIFVHGKLYMLKKDDRISIVLGSSNLTVQGLAGNKEINLGIQVLSDSKEHLEVMEYIQEIHNHRMPLERAIDMSRGGDIMKQYDPWFDKQTVQRIIDLAEEIFPNISQDTIDEWCDEIDYMSEKFLSILNEETLCESIDWNASKFKKDFLMKEIWAISESKHTDLWKRILNTPGERLIDSILDMLEAAENDKPVDDVINIGRIPHIIGESIASEILHKCYPEKYAIKNKRSEWGLALMLDQGNGPEYAEQMAYSQFIENLDQIFKVFAKWLGDIKVDDKYRYYVCDRFFLHIYENPRYKEMIKLYQESRKNKPWY
ncbi:MAG: NgoFVII family restriction endonuclease, partial [Candidatus Methanofastidiosa archaeon]|nr:NgoFVII family restriction endonuclease [Candidatus Methanofastidiosa archaeon]